MGDGEGDRRSGFGRIANYRLERRLGSGAQGDVYAALDLTLQRRLAVKVLTGVAARSERTRARFLREARVLASLDHPAIVRIFQAGTSELGPYYAMEYLGRGSLEAWLAAGRVLDSTAMAQLLKDILPGLGTMHDHGIVHRDLKPGNILFNEHGRAKIADFGLVLDENAQRLSQSNTVVGTPNFLAPEQWQGAKPTPQSDFYAIGVITYEALTGTVPFRADNYLALSRRVCEEPVNYGPIQALDDGDLWTGFLESLLAKSPEARPASAWAILNRLNHLIPDFRIPTIEAEPGADLSGIDTSGEAVAPHPGPRPVSRVSGSGAAARPPPQSGHRITAPTVLVAGAPPGAASGADEVNAPAESGLRVPAMPAIRYERLAIVVLSAVVGIAVLLGSSVGAGWLRARGEVARLQGELVAARTDVTRLEARLADLTARYTAREGQLASLLNARAPTSEPIVLSSQITVHVDGALCWVTFERVAPGLPHLAVRLDVHNRGGVPLPGNVDVTLYDGQARAVGRARLPLDRSGGLLEPGSRVEAEGSVRVAPPDAQPERFVLQFAS